jgi:regulator of cell morphogenesis and NO signaling
MMTTITEFMGLDHDRLDDIFERFKPLKEDDLNGASALFDEFKAGLLRHIVWEEDILFPIFEEATGMRDTGPTAVMRMEHRHIKDFLAAISEKIQTEQLEGIDEAENRLLESLGSHNQKEEAILYPTIDNLIGAQGTEQVIAKLNKISSGNLNPTVTTT